jgi:hypothetical protein
MNEGLSGSNGVDDIEMRPQGEIRRATNLVKITVDVRRFVAEQGVTGAKALEKAMEDKSRDFVREGLAPKRNI